VQEDKGVGSEGEMSGSLFPRDPAPMTGIRSRECRFPLLRSVDKNPRRISRLIFDGDLYLLVVGRVIEIPVLAKRV
jgi:hypothetical protein